MFIKTAYMRLHIAPNRLICDIQREFNKVFPYLKLEFFNNRSFSRSDFSSSQLIPNNKKIGDSQLVITDGDIDITEEMKVIELERIFKQDFSLAVQVFRKSGNLWLETTMTDDWSLHQQNYHGREISTGKSTDPTPEDYDLNRDASR